MYSCGCGIGKKTKNIQTALVKNKLNFTELLKSWEKLIASGCMTFYPGHGKLIPLQKLKDSYEKTKEAFVFHN